MIKLVCAACRVTDIQSLTCKACHTANLLRISLVTESNYHEILLNTNSLVAFHKNGKVSVLRGNLTTQQKVNLRRLVSKNTQYHLLEDMNLGEFEVYIETINDEKDHYKDIKLLLHLPASVSDPNYCFIKI